jgi:hypothetical protein
VTPPAMRRGSAAHAPIERIASCQLDPFDGRQPGRQACSESRKDDVKLTTTATWMRERMTGLRFTYVPSSRACYVILSANSPANA